MEEREEKKESKRNKGREREMRMGGKGAVRRYWVV